MTSAPPISDAPASAAGPPRGVCGRPRAGDGVQAARGGARGTPARARSPLADGGIRLARVLRGGLRRRPAPGGEPSLVAPRLAHARDGPGGRYAVRLAAK